MCSPRSLPLEQKGSLDVDDKKIDLRFSVCEYNNSASQRFSVGRTDGRTTYQTAFGQSSLDRIRQAVFCRPTPKAGFRYFGDGWIRGRIHFVQEHQLGLLHLSAPPTSSSKLNLTSCIIVVKRRSALCFMGMAFVTDARILT